MTKALSKGRAGGERLNSIVQLLSNTGYIMYNKTIARTLGVNEAILIGEFCSKYQYWLDKGDLLANDGWFYVTRKQIEEDTGLTDNQQRSALQSLKDNAIIEAQRKGAPSQMWYRLNVEELDDLMSKNCTTSGLKSGRLVVEKVDDIYMYSKKDNKKENKDIGDKPQRKAFIKPTLDEVTAYCKERGKGVDPTKWFNYYTANGWKVGKNPMKDWQAAVRTWEPKKKEEDKYLE